MNATHQSGSAQPSKSSKKLPLAVSVPLTVGMAFTSAVMPVSAMADQTVAVVPAAVQQPAPAEVPAADILDVDFSDGTAADTAQNLPITEHGNPQIELDPALDRNAVTFDGESALQSPFGDQYEQMTDSFSVECVFRYNGDLPSSGQTNLCANKEAGGFAVAMFADRLTFELHTGSYQNIGMEIEPNQWYHAVATFDGADQTARLYVNGELAAEVETVGTEMNWPANPGAHNMTLGADSSTNGAQFYSTSTLASARVFSDALTADQVAAMNDEAFAGLRDQTTEIASSTPAAGEHITANTVFDVQWEEPALVAQDTTYTLDGEPIAIGDEFGVGLTSGEHVIGVEGKTVFGQPIAETITFTSGSIPETGGTDTAQGQGTVTLSARAINPDGGDVTSTFYAGETDIAQEGFQGLTHEIPTTLEFEYQDGAEISGSGESLSAAQDQVAFQRFDVAVGDAVEGQTVRWAGSVDPSREVTLMVWNTATESWDAVAAGRGLTEGELVLSGELVADHLNADGAASVLVVAEDPFADDLDNEVADAFENPDDYDFAIAHLTDTQYLAEGAAEDAYSEEQQAIWAQSYTDTIDWIVENADERKIDYVAHTGDIIENWHTGGPVDDEAGYREIAIEEFEFASDAQQVLDDAEIVNGVLPGNHDNRSGNDVGAESLYNDYFGLERYEALEQTAGWQDAQASYTPWREGDNENHYDLFTAGGLDFIAVHLGYDFTKEELDWASEVLNEYSDRNAMVMTHAHRRPSTEPDGRGTAFSHDGSRVDQDVGTEGNHIVELLADYQFYEVSAEELGLTGIDQRNPDDMLRFGSSFFRMLQIDVDNSELAVDTYSALLDNFGATEDDDRKRYNGTEDDTRLPIQLETRKTSFSTESGMVTTPTDDVIGEATARSGWPASVELSGLTEGETYAWYAVSRDAESGEDLPTGEAQQMGVFTATTAGTDDVAPELTVPEAATIAAGDAFDPMAGVSATDNADGDLTAAVQVMTDLDTTVPGVYVVTYLVEDSTGNQATATRAVTVTEAETDTAPDEGQTGDDQNGGSDDTEQKLEGDDTADGDDSSDGAAPVGGTDTPGGATDGDGPLDDERTFGSATDVENAEGFLANTGANGTVLLVLGGLLSVAFGVAAWQISRRRSAMN